MKTDYEVIVEALRRIYVSKLPSYAKVNMTTEEEYFAEQNYLNTHNKTCKDFDMYN